MARYIDAERAIHLIENDALLQVYYSKSDAIDCINATPTADVANVKHGEWMDNCNGTFTCSVCGGRASKMNYCGNCGAKMV